MCAPTLVYGAATPATRIIANGVPIEIVFVTDESELPANPDLDTDDYNQPIPSMKGASCSSLDGPNCLSMLYDSVDFLGDDALEFDFTTEELMRIIHNNLGDLGLDGLIETNFEFGDDAYDSEGYMSTYGYVGYLSNERLLGAGIVDFLAGFSKVYARRVSSKPSPLPEEHATDMATYAEEVGLSEDFVPQFDFFWSNLENDDYEYQVYVLDSNEVSGTNVAEQLEAYLDGSIQPAHAPFDVFTFIIDFDGIKALDLELYPPDIRRLYVQPQRFLEDLAESLRENPQMDDDEDYDEDYDFSDVYGVVEDEDGYELVIGEDGLELAVDDVLLTLLEDEDQVDSNTNTISSSASGSGRRRREGSTINDEDQHNSQSRTNTDSTSAASSSSPSSISKPHDAASTQGEGRPIKPKGSR